MRFQEGLAICVLTRVASSLLAQGILSWALHSEWFRSLASSKVNDQRKRDRGSGGEKRETGERRKEKRGRDMYGD